MGRKANAGPPSIKNHKLALEQYIPQNLDRLPLTALQPAVAHPPAQTLVVDELAGDRRHVPLGPKLHFQVRQGGVAGEGEARVGAFRASDFGVVGLQHGVVDEEERGAGVGDGGRGVGVRDRGVGADGEGRGGELPVALGVVDAGELHGADELAEVDGAKLVAARGGVFEVCGEEGGFQRGGDVAEEGVLFLGRDGVAAHEAEAHQAVRVLVLDEGVGHGGCQLDGLFGDCGGADGDGVGAHVARGAGFIAVGDFEA